MPINFKPKYFPPSDVVKASCMILSIEDQNVQNVISLNLLRCVWVEEKDIGNLNTLTEFYNKMGLKIDEKLYSSNDIFDSGRWDGDYSSQQYDYDDEMILADSTEREFGTMSSPSSVDWYFE